MKVIFALKNKYLILVNKRKNQFICIALIGLKIKIFLVRIYNKTTYQFLILLKDKK